MKNCSSCKQPIGEGICVCPICGAALSDGPAFIGNFRVVSTVCEGYASVLYRATPQHGGADVVIRLFKPEAGLDEEKAKQLRHEVDQLRQIPAANFVRHNSIAQTDDGQWYLVSEWVDAEAWAILRGRGLFSDPAQRRHAFDLFATIALSIAAFHQHGHIIPHLLLSDILVCRATGAGFSVKLDYKLSRILDPRLDHPSPPLKLVLESHPDILAGRPLDRRSDVWSLGKLFVELLTGVDGTAQWDERIAKLRLPERFLSLLRQMLADDPDKRLRSMAEVARLLNLITSAEIERAANPEEENASRLERRTTRLQRIFVSLVLAIIVFGGLAVFMQLRYGIFSHSESRAFALLAERYSRSVALVAVEYRLEDTSGKLLGSGVSQGTAFLADSDGYLISNRHVICPWLVDGNFQGLLAKLVAENKKSVFKYRINLWFEGVKGIKRQQEQIANPTITDYFHTDTAYRTDGEPRVSIAGVIMPPTESLQLLRSPLGDDVAILKIDSVPSGVVPIPLDSSINPVAGKKLMPILAIGFPGGKGTIADNIVTANTTIGHIRATYNNLFLGNISLHGGNSGGPIISQDGVVVGIASAVRMDKADLGLFSIPIAQSDFAMILPIALAKALLTRLKAGEPAWNGVPVPEISTEIIKLVADASNGNLEEARQWWARQGRSSVAPELLTFGGLVHVCLNDHATANSLLSRAATINPRGGFTHFLHYVNDWQTGKAAENRYRKELLSLDWRSPDEFWGYLTRILEGQIATESAENAGETVLERDLLAWTLASIDMQSNRLTKAEERLRHALLHDDGVEWSYLLIRARLEQLEREREKEFTGKELVRYRNESATYHRRSKATSIELHEKKAIVDALAKVKDDPKGTAVILRKVVQKVPAVSDLPAYQMSLGFHEALLGNWKDARLALESYLPYSRRESANYLGAGLFSAQLLALMGKQEESLRALQAYAARTNDPWYRKLAQGALGEVSVEVLEAAASDSPEKFLTAQFMLGLKAEVEKNPAQAQQHYAQAFESFLPNWLEYLFARERLKMLRTVK